MVLLWHSHRRPVFMTMLRDHPRDAATHNIPEYGTPHPELVYFTKGYVPSPVHNERAFQLSVSLTPNLRLQHQFDATG